MKLFVMVFVILAMLTGCSVDSNDLGMVTETTVGTGGTSVDAGIDKGPIKPISGTAGTNGTAGHVAVDSGVTTGAAGETAQGGSGGTVAVTGVSGQAGTNSAAGSGGSGVGGTMGGSLGTAGTAPGIKLEYRCDNCGYSGNVPISFTIKLTAGGSLFNLDNVHLVYWFSPVQGARFSSICSSHPNGDCMAFTPKVYTPNNAGNPLPVPSTATEYEEVALSTSNVSVSVFQFSVVINRMDSDSTSQLDDYSFNAQTIDFTGNPKVALYKAPSNESSFPIGVTGFSPFVGVQP